MARQAELSMSPSMTTGSGASDSLRNPMAMTPGLHEGGDFD